MNNVPEELIEAAKLEKAPNSNIFTKIVMPLTSSTAVYILIMTIVQGLQYVFTPIKVLTQGGPIMPAQISFIKDMTMHSLIMKQEWRRHWRLLQCLFFWSSFTLNSGL